MPFHIVWLDRASAQFAELQNGAERSLESRRISGTEKASKQEGLFKQTLKCIDMLAANPRHPGLQTHKYRSIRHPYRAGEKVFEAYAQNRTPGAYRVFWCYGPGKNQITLIAITAHP